MSDRFFPARRGRWMPTPDGLRWTTAEQMEIIQQAMDEAEARGVIRWTGEWRNGLKLYVGLDDGEVEEPEK